MKLSGDEINIINELQERYPSMKNCDDLSEEISSLINYTKDLKTVEGINKSISELPENEKELISDGYHTFKELYAHRVKLFVALLNTVFELDMKNGGELVPHTWKSTQHDDGSMYDGWFIAGINTEKGKTITYHLPISEWGNLRVYEKARAPEWDGHTSDDVLRLLSDF